MRPWPMRKIICGMCPEKHRNLRRNFESNAHGFKGIEQRDATEKWRKVEPFDESSELAPLVGAKYELLGTSIWSSEFRSRDGVLSRSLPIRILT